MSAVTKCPRCSRVLMGSAGTCVVHGDQVDIGGREPALETIADQRRHDSARYRRPSETSAADQQRASARVTLMKRRPS